MQSRIHVVGLEAVARAWRVCGGGFAASLAHHREPEKAATSGRAPGALV